VLESADRIEDPARGSFLTLLACYAGVEVIAGIIDQTYPEGAMLPSVRGLAQLYDVNPLTAAKAYRELQRDGFVEALRGEGLIVRNGMRVGLMKRERAKFMKEEWPALRARLARLEVDLKALLATASD
jgi:GntR family transcriptional regulator